MNFELCYVIRAYRMAIGITQADLASSVDRSGCFISLYERGKADGSGLETKMRRFLLKVAKQKKLDPEFYEAKAALILCDIYRKLDGTVTSDVLAYAKEKCRVFAEKE